MSWPAVPGCGPVPEDYDGDGIMELAVYQLAAGFFGIRYSSTGTSEIIGPLGSGFLPIR